MECWYCRWEILGRMECGKEVVYSLYHHKSTTMHHDFL